MKDFAEEIRKENISVTIKSSLWFPKKKFLFFGDGKGLG